MGKRQNGDQRRGKAYGHLVSREVRGGYTAKWRAREQMAKCRVGEGERVETQGGGYTAKLRAREQMAKCRVGEGERVERRREWLLGYLGLGCSHESQC